MKFETKPGLEEGLMEKSAHIMANIAYYFPCDGQTVETSNR